MLQRAIASFFFLLCGSLAGHAQTDGTSFGVIDVGIQGRLNVNRTQLHTFWQPGPGLELTAETPFLMGVPALDGRLQAGVRAMRFTPRVSTVPDFSTLFLYVGWGKTWPLPLRFSGFAGVQFGGYRMAFDDPEVNRFFQTESEMASGGMVALRYRATRHWQVQLSGTYLVVFTARRMHLGHLGLGLIRSFQSPDWLKTFLQ